MNRPPAPPRWIEARLRALIPDGAAGPSSVLGDLHEEYVALRASWGHLRADLWYTGQAVRLGVPWAVRKGVAAAAELSSGVLLDLRASVRSLRRTPALAVVAVASLALGAGLTTAAATVVNAAWFAPLDYPEADRLVDLEDTHPTEVCRGCSPGASYRSFLEWRDGLGGTFERMAASYSRRVNLRHGDTPMSVGVGLYTDGFSELLGLEARLGRGFAPGDFEAAAPPVVLLAHGFWTRSMGADPGVIGRVVELDGAAHTVIGVLSEESRPLGRHDAFVPIRPGTLDATSHSARGLWVLARLAPGVGEEAAHDALASWASASYAADPELEPGWSAVVLPLRSSLARSGAEPAAGVALIVLSLLVLLVAAMNLASLLVARVTDRERELGVRAALGAGRLRIARAGVMDALVLSVLGGLGGAFIVWIARDLAVARFSADLPPWVRFPIDVRVLGAAVGAVALAALVSGLLPLLRAARVRGLDGIATGALGRSAGRRLRVHDLLLGAQIVLGIVLVAGSAGALRTFLIVRDFDRLGHRWEGIASVMVVPGADDLRAAASALQTEAGRHPAVERHALSHSLFLGSWGSAEAPSPVWVNGAAEAMPNTRVPRHSMAVGPGFFALMEIPVIAGRPIGSGDRAGGSPVAVVSRDAASEMWPGVPLDEIPGRGFRVTIEETTQAFDVIGIAEDVVGNPSSESGRSTPRIYTALEQTHPALLEAAPGAGIQLRLVLRDPAPTPAEWAVWVDRVSPGASVSSVFSVEESLRSWIRPIWITGAAFGGLAALVLVLLMVGIYGTVAYRIASIRREIGVRMALGARSGEVVRAVTGRIARVVGVAVVAGGVLAWAGDRILSAGGVPIGDADPAILLGVGLLLCGVAALASLGPLRRALSIDPATSLRAE